MSARGQADGISAGVILALNAGSSSLKFSVFGVTAAGALSPLLQGQIEGIGRQLHLRAMQHPQADDAGPAGVAALVVHDAVGAPGPADHEHALAELLAFLAAYRAHLPLLGVGHRVVHGGAAYSAPVLVDAAVTRELEALVPLAPLHQPHSLAIITALARRMPQVSQVACFDTAFHHGRPQLSQLCALPYRYFEDGVRRYGFHGLSFEYVWQRCARLGIRAPGRVIVAHLGSGASLCAIRAGQSIEVTTGFSALDGLPMGTRCGMLDPGVVLHLATHYGMAPGEIETLLYRQSGLLGISGISNDMRDLLQDASPRARLAVDYFVYRVVQEIGRLAATLDGLDALVFTAGIGEHAAPVRAAVCERLRHLFGIRLDARLNAESAQGISQADSAVEVFVIPTDEERMLAEHTLALLQPPPQPLSSFTTETTTP